ncbi:MAG: peptidase T [Clostridiales bacterium]|nr:peptidase T [Clostridiales bacterium]
MTVCERFLRYVSFDTQSNGESQTVPSTAKQLVLAEELRRELAELGLEDVKLDEYGRVYGRLPATAGCEALPGLGLIAHMDTAGEESGANVKPRIVDYQGGDIVLNEALGIVLSPREFPSLNRYVGKHLIVTDGTTLLGADDKAGVAEIISAVAWLVEHPEVAHRAVYVAFTPDEEIGRGPDHFDFDTFQVPCAYTVDGGELGGLEYENFNAAAAKVTIRGRSIHPGAAKNKMVNAVLLASELIQMLPPAETPAHTEGYEGFYHVGGVKGDTSSATVWMIIRDHDRASFEARKAYLEQVVAFLNAKYGEERFTLELRDSYYNMKSCIEPHMELIEQARQAFLDAGVEPCVVPIRGGTDGARLSYEGLPCPNLSVGGVNYHGLYEYIPVESMEAMVQVLVNLVQADGR